MTLGDYTILDDEQLAELLVLAEDRLELAAAKEIAGRDSMLPVLSQLVESKQSWLAELPDWWSVVHATYLLGFRGGEEVVMPLLSALRWADAFDCDWVTEVLPSIFGSLGPMVFPGLIQVARDRTAGWSARDVALKGLAAVSLKNPEHREHVFSVIGERFMDEGEDRMLRQLAGQVLLDFRHDNYRLALLKFAREEWSLQEMDAWYISSFSPQDVEWTFRAQETSLWHYQEDWMRFYAPSEIQRRQKRWQRERLAAGRPPLERRPSSGGRVLPLGRPAPQGQESPGPDKEPEDSP